MDFSSPRSCGIVLAISVTALLIGGCHAQSERPDPAAIASRVKALTQKAKADLVEVQGGEFLMGDFGEIHSDDKLPYTSELDNKPLHKVGLSDYAIQKYKVTYGDFDTYAQAKGLPLPYTSPTTGPFERRIRKHPKSASFPIGVDWYDAKGYCEWLGQQIGRKMDLPTEAQWEYAARARGQFLIYPTDNGLYEKGRNVASADDAKRLGAGWATPNPIGLYPPNPLGLYDMAKNGFEWVQDWYAEDYYEHSPVQDPQGPSTGTKKVLRSLENGESYASLTMERRKYQPKIKEDDENATAIANDFRCVAVPVKKQ
jgi:formylglycine-generating enzyme required for sulfatase activity